MIRFSKGNSKVGPMAVFNIPAITSCPGRTPWCSTHCYAAKVERRWSAPREMYAANLRALSEGAPLPTLPRGTTIVRIHANGDFYSAEYAQQWAAYVANNPGVTFYAYTRSWRIAAILPALEALRALPNMTLFASMDESTTDAPPSGWRVAYIAGDEKASGPLCMEQTGKQPNCVACGYCFKAKRGNIQFTTH